MTAKLNPGYRGCRRLERTGVPLALIGVLLLLLVSAPSVRGETTAPGDPWRVIDGLHDKLVTVMQRADELGYRGRYVELEPVIRERFDTPLIVKVILSRYWNDLDDRQRALFIELFLRLSVATYASRFDGFDGERFVNVGVEQLKKNRLLIRTELQRPKDTPIELDYLMHQGENGYWMIISVIANGVNDLSLKRAEYAAVLKDRGFDGLVQDIESKITKMEAGTDEEDYVVPGS